jgi:hypothetical protein
MHFRTFFAKMHFLTGRLRDQNGKCFQGALVHLTRKLRGFNMHTTDLRLERPAKGGSSKNKDRIMHFTIKCIFNAKCISLNMHFYVKCIILSLCFEPPPFVGSSNLKYVVCILKPHSLRVKCTNAPRKHLPFWSRNRPVKKCIFAKKVRKCIFDRSIALSKRQIFSG